MINPCWCLPHCHKMIYVSLGVSRFSIVFLVFTSFNVWIVICKWWDQVEVLSAVVNSVANSVSANTIVDVGAGQVCPLCFLLFYFLCKRLENWDCLTEYLINFECSCESVTAIGCWESFIIIIFIVVLIIWRKNGVSVLLWCGEPPLSTKKLSFSREREEGG